jgi:cytochrome c oxidase cbb3-type subunit 3
MHKAPSIKKSMIALITIMTSSLAAISQAVPASAAPTKPSVYDSPVFYLLVLVAFILLIFIIQLGRVLTTIASNYGKGNKSVWDKFGMIAVLFMASMFMSEPAVAQAAANAAATAIPEKTPVLDFLHQGFGMNAINALVLIILIELAFVLFLVRMIKLMIIKEKAPSEYKELEPSTSVFWDKFNNSVAVSEEAAVMTDHDYDGIRELDNALPPWWKYGFYFTIVWAFVYLIYFHISGGPSSLQEYQAQMDEGAMQVAAYQAKAKDLVTEKTVTFLSSASDMSAGSALFTQYCAVCHRPDGGGLVGPNLTDNYWIHGGDIKNIFATIKYGIQGKGMKSWQQELSPIMTAQVASYVMSLKGSKPANPKAPEGKEELGTTSITSDTSNVLIIDTLQKPIDTLKVATAN